MVANNADALTKRHELELARLKRGYRLSSKVLMGLGVIAVLALVVGLRLILRSEGDPASLAEARSSLVRVSGDWGHDLSDAQESYTLWLSRHGTALEARLFARLSQGLFESAASFHSRFEEPGFLAKIYLGLHGGLLRAGFIVLASLRLWLVVCGGFLFVGLRPLKPWSGRDALGQTGNGRVFFSGVRIGLDAPTPEGAPSLQVTGLACPAAVPLPQAKSSGLAKILEKFGAMTGTNLKLVAIIEQHREVPAYIPPPGEERGLAGFFEGVSLSANTERLLQGALRLHAVYRGEAESDSEEQLNPGEVLKAARQGRKVTAEQHAALVVEALNRVLTPRMKDALALLDAASVATVLLALEAGKSLAYIKEGGQWVRKSNFPQLSARAVLHSIPDFGQEYDFDLRATIRRALIFGARSSVFAPVKFPVDFRPESRAARQWVEILMASPHLLATVADEVQLLGLLNELHQKWEQGFFDGAQALDPEVIDQVFATPQNLIFIPVARIVALMRRLTDPSEMQQLEALISVVSQEQRQRTASRSATPEGEEVGSSIPSYERIFPPFGSQEIKALTELYSVSADDARAWSSLRVVLNAYGWLGRRVADRSVPESSIVFAVSKVGDDFPGANSLGLLGTTAVVPLRATRLEERWGKLWGSRFMLVGNTRIAENRADFERLLAGKDDDLESEAQPPPTLQGTGG